MPRRVFAATTLVVATLGACSVYDESLLEEKGDEGSTSSSTTATTSSTGGGGGQGGEGGNGATSTTSTTSTSSGGGGGGAPECSTPGDCPGQDTECATRACDGGVCGFTYTGQGVLLVAQTPGDCVDATCDGAGGVVPQPNDTDLEDDGDDCTTDTCLDGLPVHTLVAAGGTCMGNKYCAADGSCVECLVNAHCASQICDATLQCSTAQCNDSVKNGAETAVDCGGGTCAPCATGQACLAGTDCVGGTCTGNVCAATCTDGVKNQTETDVDCGGGCAPCAIGQGCSVVGDCQAGACQSNVCVCSGTHLLLSEIRSRGANSAFDELVELYNPTSAPVTLDATWKIEARSSSAASYKAEWTGSGEVIPAHGHLLIIGNTYAQQPAGDNVPGASDIGITDAASVRLVQGAVTIDAVCYYFSAGTLNDYAVGVGFDCEGTPVSNSPHNNTTNGASNSDVSIERKPGGLALGNCVDSGDSAADWQTAAPANPQNLLSAPTP